jgi:hypothetical protein
MNEARAWAALGNGEQARAAIDRAERARDTVRADDLDDHELHASGQSIVAGHGSDELLSQVGS